MTAEERTIVQIVQIDDTGDSYHRITWPAAQLAHRNPHWRIINLTFNAAERYEWARAADLLVIYQSMDRSLIPVIRERRAAGRKTLVETNDNFYSAASWAPIASAWSSPLLWHSYEAFMDEADGVIVTGDGLQKLMLSVTTTPLHILQNHMPTVPEEFSLLWEKKGDGIVLGWAGSIGHAADILACAPVIRAVLKEFPALHYGFLGNEEYQRLLNLPEGQGTFHGWRSLPEYLRFLGTLKLGIIPFLPTAYNLCRSDVKALEMAFMGVCPLVPDAAPYHEFIAGAGIEPYHSSSHLHAQIEFFTTHPDELRERAQRCHDYVARRRVGANRSERSHLFQSHLTPARSSFIWPLPCGYHEVNGTPQPISPLIREREFLNRCLKEARYAEGFAETQTSQYLDDPTLALLRLRCLSKEDKHRTSSEISAAILKFPKDIRFSVIKSSVLVTAPEQVLLWAAISDALSQETGAYQKFFEKLVIEIFTTVFLHFLELLPAAQTLEQIYPDNAKLLFAIAEALRNNNQEQRAFRYYQKLRTIRQHYEVNKEFLESCSLSYFDALCEGIGNQEPVSEAE